MTNARHSRRGWGILLVMSSKLPLVLAAVILAGVAYWFWPLPETPQPAVEPAEVAAAPAAAPFLVRANVRTILEQQQKIAAAGSRGDIAAAETRIRLAAQEIRTRLVSDGIHGEAAMLSVVRAAAAQSGFNEEQASAAAQALRSSNTKEPGTSGIVGGVRKALGEVTGLPSQPVEPK